MERNKARNFGFEMDDCNQKPYERLILQTYSTISNVFFRRFNAFQSGTARSVKGCVLKDIYFNTMFGKASHVEFKYTYSNLNYIINYYYIIIFYN